MESKYTNKYEVACAILDKLEQGGSGGGKFVLVDGTKFGNSTFTEVPENFDFSEVNDFNRMFLNCENLTTVPSLDTSNCTDFEYMFSGCKKLITIQQLDLSKGTNFDSMFQYCTALENISFVGSINNNIRFTGGVLNTQYARITDDSIKSILTACSNTTNTNAKTLSFKFSLSRVISDPNGEFAALVADCTTKGWTITGLTLE